MKIKAMNSTRFYAHYRGEHDFLKDVVDFANGDGGTIYFGVEGDGTVRGQEIYAHTLAEIDEIVNANIRPKVAIDIFKQRFENKDILAVRVNSYTGSRNREKSVFLLTEEISDLPQVSFNKPVTPPAESALDYDRLSRVGWFLAVSRRIADISMITRRQIDIYLTESGLLANGNLNDSGMLLFADSQLLSERFPYAFIECGTRSARNTGDIERVQFRGSLFNQIESATDFVCFKILRRLRKIREESSRELGFPLHIIQPLFAMAVAYRDYAQKQPIEMWLNGRELNLSVPGMKEQQLLLGMPMDHSYQQILSALKQTGYYQETMTITEMNSILSEYGLKSLKYQVQKQKLVLTLVLQESRREDPVRRRDKDVDERKKQMLKLIRLHPHFTLEDIAVKLGISKATAKLYSLQLQEDGKLLRTGSRRRGAWEIID